MNDNDAERGTSEGTCGKCNGIKLIERRKICGGMFSKEKISIPGGIRIKHKAFGYTYLSKVSQNGLASYRFLHIPICCKTEDLRSAAETQNTVRMLQQTACTLFIDHALGGGADYYFTSIVPQLAKECPVLRLQYLPDSKSFRLSYYVCEGAGEHSMLSFKKSRKLFGFLGNIDINRIIVSNLVSYEVLDVLGRIEAIAEKKNIPVTFLCHDYHALCPSFTLTDKQGAYCGAVKDISLCRKCFKTLILGNNSYEHNILISGATDISTWRQAWGHFLLNVATSIIAFDESVRELFESYYPALRGRIIITPHKVAPLRKVAVSRSHGGHVVVVILGTISSPAKGAKVLAALDEAAPRHPGISLVLVGQCATPLRNIRIWGKYQQSELPDIMEEVHAGIVLIPSVWPETFSYTTAEVMNMEMPVACFSLGAPQCRISRYSKGLVLDLSLADKPDEVIRALERFVLDGALC